MFYRSLATEHPNYPGYPLAPAAGNFGAFGGVPTITVGPNTFLPSWADAHRDVVLDFVHLDHMGITPGHLMAHKCRKVT